jgi:hypothetical protein
MNGVVQSSGRSNVSLVLVPPNKGLGGVRNAKRSSAERYEQFRDYIEAASTFGVERFDRVLIDGRSRPECAVAVLQYLGSESRVFIHDFTKSRYEPGEYGRLLDQYAVEAQIKEGQGLVVLRPR